MMIPTGDRTIHHRGSLLAPADGPDPRPLLVHLGERTADLTRPDLREPIDSTWLKLEPVAVAGELVPIAFATENHYDEDRDPFRFLGDRLARRDLRLTVFTIGPFKSPRLLEAIRAHGQRRLSLTVEARDDDRHTRLRWPDVQIALDADVQHYDEARWWLDWIDGGQPWAPRMVGVSRELAVTASP